MLLDTTLLVAGGGNDEAGNVYLTSCDCGFGRDYDPQTESNGILWRIVQADEVGDGAVTAPLEPEGSPAPEETNAPEETAAAETAAPEETDGCRDARSRDSGTGGDLRP